MKLVRDENDITNDIKEGAFNPEFTHQFFGENENVFGYRGLKVKLFYAASSLTRYISVDYAEKVNPKISQGVEADDILGIITEKLEGDYLSNLDKFSKIVQSDHSFMPLGEKLHSFESVGKDGSKRTFEIYNASSETPGFTEYNARIRTFLLWFIDGASYIDDEDDRWDFFVLYEKVPNILTGNGSIFYFVGFTSVYRYYAYPGKIRPRISQVLILPPVQRRGLGAELLKTIYNYYMRDANVLDITVEDPSDNFVRLRDYVDCVNCRKLEPFSKENLSKPWSDKIAEFVREKLRLNKKQARRVFEILKLASIDRSDVEKYRNYRLEVKQRLNAPFAKLNRSMDKSFDQTSALNTKEVRIEELTNMYRETEEEYLEVIEKLATV